MQLTVQILAILVSLAMLVVVVGLVYQRRLREAYSLLWLLAASSLLGLSVFGGVLTRVALFLDIGYAPSLLFAVGLLFAMVILLSQSVVISNLARKSRDLAQKLAILEWHVARLQAEIGEEADGESESTGKSDRREQVLIVLREPEVTQ